MTPDLNTFVRLVGESLKDPGEIARQIVALRLPHQVGWMGLLSVTLLSLITIYAETLLPGSTGDVGIGFGGKPFLDAIFLGALTVIMVFLFYYAGRAIGGAGTFGATLLIMAWFQAVVLALVVVQLLATFLVPDLGGIFALIVVAIELYCLAHFLNVLHQFQNVLKAAFLILLCVCGLAIGLSIIVLLIGGASQIGGI